MYIYLALCVSVTCCYQINFDWCQCCAFHVSHWPPDDLAAVVLACNCACYDDSELRPKSSARLHTHGTKSSLSK